MNNDPINGLQELAQIYERLVIAPAGNIGAQSAGVNSYDDAAKELKAAIARLAKLVAVQEVAE